MPIQKVEIEVDIPDGFEATGEVRPPGPGEWYLNGKLAVQGSVLSPCLILKKKPLEAWAVRYGNGKWSDLLFSENDADAVSWNDSTIVHFREVTED